MNIEQEIRAQIEKNKGLKLAVGEINNHLSILEGLLRNERDDAQKQVNEAYQRGVEDGRNETWEVARRIAVNMDVHERARVFFQDADAVTHEEPFKSYSAQEAIAKLKAYEEQKAVDEIKVGDEVKLRAHKENYLVTSYKQDGDMCNLMDVRGGFFRVKKCDIHKTGRHFDIEKILEEMASMSIN